MSLVENVKRCMKEHGEQAVEIEKLQAALRKCTCHPDDNPPVPCAGKFALSDCRHAQFERYDDLPYDTTCHLAILEGWIGGLDGMDLTNWQQGEGSEMHGTDEGTIDAEDAVKAVNALIYAIRCLKGQRDRLREEVQTAFDLGYRAAGGTISPITEL